MNWLGPVLKRINRSEHPEPHRIMLMIRAVDLSEICDRFVPLAPEPNVVGQVAHFNQSFATGTEFGIGWKWAARGRELIVIVTAARSWALRLVDGERRQLLERPAFEELKTSVRSFFEGWEPQS